MSSENEWVNDVERAIFDFSTKYSSVYNKNKRELSASFEIGCFHALINYYEKMEYSLSIENMVDQEYRYLTTPNGNPANFSYIKMEGQDGVFEIRQQVRIFSHLDKNIAFAPDIVVLFRNAEISAIKDPDFASGKRPFYTVSSKYVVSAHECKSMIPFPELLVSFVGMFITAHEWFNDNKSDLLSPDGNHIAPTLFVGGTARAMHLKMIQALEKVYPINIVVGLHTSEWNLYSGSKKVNRLNFKAITNYESNDIVDEIPF